MAQAYLDVPQANSMSAGILGGLQRRSHQDDVLNLSRKNIKKVSPLQAQICGDILINQKCRRCDDQSRGVNMGHIIQNVSG